MNNINSTRLTPRSSAIVLSACLLVSATVTTAADLTLPVTYVTGNTLTAADLNDNFQATKTAVDGNVADIATNAADVADNITILNDHESRVSSVEANSAGNTTDIADHESRITTLEATKTGYLTVPAAAFRPADSSTTYTGGTSNPYLSITGGTLQMMAPLYLPEGATITGLSMRAWDVSATNFATVGLRKYAGTATTTLVSSVVTTDVESGGYYVKGDNTLSEVVSYAGSNLPHYYLVFSVDSAGSGSGPAIYAARITYTH